VYPNESGSGTQTVDVPMTRRDGQGEKSSIHSSTTKVSGEKKKKKLFVVRKCRILGVIILLMILSSGIGLSVMYTNQSLKVLRSSIIVSNELTDFTKEFGRQSSTFRLMSFVAGYSTLSDIWMYYAYESIEFEQNSFNKLSDKFDQQKKKAPSLKNANKEFKRVKETFYVFTEYQTYTADTIVALAQGGNRTFDEFFLAFADTYGGGGGSSYDNFMDAVAKFSKKLGKISKQSESVNQSVTLSVESIFLLAAIALSFAIYYIIINANARIEAQEKLARQQAHEMRSLYSPAIFCIDLFVEMIQKSDCTIHDVIALQNDMQAASCALRQVEFQLQARLDIYKILRKNYIPQLDFFDVKALMQEAVNLEDAILRAQSRGNNTNVEFRVVISNQIIQGEQGDKNMLTCDEVHIHADHYILNHLIQNTLSNARKHTHAGNITITLERATTERGGRLYFSVSDTGTGIPSYVVANLFKTEVATGDIRGTGLGLPSCILFAKTAKGHIRLRSTRVQNETGVGGFSVFEFCVYGKIVRVDSYASSTDIVSTQVDPQETQYTNHSIKQNSNQCPEKVKSIPQENNIQTHECIQKKEAASSEHKTDEEIKPPRRPEQKQKQKPQAPLLNDIDDTNKSIIPDTLTIVIVDDSALIRNCLKRSFKRIQKEQVGSNDWSYAEFETIEASQQYICQLHETNTMAIICLDENMDSRGGKLRGIQGTRWLIEDLGWRGIIISSSGDPDVGEAHLELGAHLVWGKPIPKKDKMSEDLIAVFSDICI